MAQITSERRSLLRQRLVALVRDTVLNADIEAQVDHLLAEVFEDDPLTAPAPLLIDDMPDDQRIVITGMGLITPFGIGINPFWQNLLAGHSAIGPITRFDTSEFPCRIAGEVADFAAQDFMDFKEARRMSRASQFAVAAGRMAMDDADLRVSDVGSDQIGVLVGCGTTSMPDLEQAMLTFVHRHPMKISPLFIPSALPNMPACQLAIQLGIHGYTSAISTACAASAQAIGEAAAVLRRGEATVILAGGTEAPISALSLGSFSVMRALSMRNEEPERASRPFDVERDGFVPAEGAGVLVLETLANARRRDARVYAELIGYASSCDAYHVTAPDPQGEGAARAIRRAFISAGIDPQQVDYINAHATSTPAGDIAETRAIKHVFGEYAYSVPISAPKSMIGHLTGAAGVVEAAATILALRHSRIPPTINLEQPDAECDLDYVPNMARHADIQIAISNSFGFGGVNAVLVLRRFDA